MISHARRRRVIAEVMAQRLAATGKPMPAVPAATLGAFGAVMLATPTPSAAESALVLMTARACAAAAASLEQLPRCVALPRGVGRSASGNAVV